MTKMGNGWDWTQSNTIPEIAASDFTKSNGYLKKTVEIPFGNEIVAENDLHQIALKLAGYQCNYNGDVYIDNIQLIDRIAPTVSNDPATVFSNDFDDNANLPINKTAADVVSDENGSEAVKYNVKFTGSSWEVPASIILMENLIQQQQVQQLIRVLFK
ncbi:MAG: hypothetical protein Q8936_05935 [Bacillota bacterium]|nr:hypothetical protein [Bacillota bacterium]